MDSRNLKFINKTSWKNVLRELRWLPDCIAGGWDENEIDFRVKCLNNWIAFKFNSEHLINNRSYTTWTAAKRWTIVIFVLMVGCWIWYMYSFEHCIFLWQINAGYGGECQNINWKYVCENFHISYCKYNRFRELKYNNKKLLTIH